MNNLVIIGNGFDLAHNMKTSYNHFIDHLIKTQFKSKQLNNLFKETFDFNSSNDFATYYKTHVRMKNDYFHNGFLGNIMIKYMSNNWCDIENKYFELLNPITDNSDFKGKPKKLNTEFEIIKNYLVDYLKTQEKQAKFIESYRKMFELVDSNETAILNFNYTNTLQSLYSHEIKGSKVIHIHGELSNPKNPIIFGYAANDEESRELIDRGDNEYMRNIKKHLYKRTENEKLLTYYLKGTKDINVTILGHSCGLSDKLILNQILNEENVKSINIFYYEEYEQYFQAQVNIDRIMNNDDNFKKLTDFNSSHRMPQHNDTPDQQEAFINYFKPICEARKNKKQQAFQERLRQENRNKIKIR